MRRLLIVFLMVPALLSLLTSPVQAANWSINGSNTYVPNNTKIGIGTTTPADPLHVVNKSAPYYSLDWGKMLIGDDAGSHWFGSWVDAASASNVQMSNGYQSSTNGAFMRRKLNQETWMTSNYITNSNQGSYTIWHAAPQNTSQITNLTPMFKINPQGIVSVKELQVKATNWADHVFEDGYDLKPLNEVESYINENNHLPGIPSEAEIREDGISLGEMSKKQMEKIEELTLYTIDLDKENKELKDRIDRLEMKMNGILNN